MWTENIKRRTTSAAISCRFEKNVLLRQWLQIIYPEIWKTIIKFQNCIMRDVDWTNILSMLRRSLDAAYIKKLPLLCAYIFRSIGIKVKIKPQAH